MLRGRRELVLRGRGLSSSCRTRVPRERNVAALLTHAGRGLWTVSKPERQRPAAWAQAGRGSPSPQMRRRAQSCLPERAHTSALMTPTPLVLQRPSHLEHPRGGGLVECRALDPPPRFCFRGQGWAPVPAMLTLPVPPHPGLQLGYVSCGEPRVAAPARSEVLVTSAQGDW